MYNRILPKYLLLLVLNTLLLMSETNIRLIKTTQFTLKDKNNPLTTTIYKYDKKNRLRLEIISMSRYPDMNASRQYIYNDKNDLIEFVLTSNFGSPKNPKIKTTRNLFYYSGNKMTKQISMSNGKLETKTYVVELENEVPIKSITEIYNEEEKVIQKSTTTLEYRDNNIFHQEVEHNYLDTNNTTFTTMDIHYGEKYSKEYYINRGNFFYNLFTISNFKSVLSIHYTTRVFISGIEKYNTNNSTTHRVILDNRNVPISEIITDSLALDEEGSYLVNEYESFILEKEI